MSEITPQRHISHDLRTPMNHIIGYSELLIEETEDRGLTSVIELLQQIRVTGKKLLTRLNEVFANRSLPAYIPLSAARSELSDIARHIVSTAEQLEPSLPTDLVSDLRKIEQAALNFLGLVDRFSVPPESDTDVPPVPSPLPRQQTAHQGTTGTLLIVDDIPDNRAVLSQLLQRQGHTILMAENGVQALEILHQSPVDVILLDIMMPVMDGHQTLRAAKADQSLSHIPVIVISALDEIRNVVQCIEDGAEDYLTKPFDAILLRARVNACLERKRLREQELRYLDHVKRLTYAAQSVETETFEPDALVDVAARDDALGNLARVFTRMAYEIYTREALLRQSAKEMQIRVNHEMMDMHVAEITSTRFFEQLRSKVRRINT